MLLHAKAAPVIYNDLTSAKVEAVEAAHLKPVCLSHAKT